MSSRRPHYASVSEYAKMIDVTPPRVYQLIDDGQLEAVKINGQWFLPLSERGREMLEEKAREARHGEGGGWE
jgi:hypothetical protein